MTAGPTTPTPIDGPRRYKNRTCLSSNAGEANQKSQVIPLSNILQAFFVRRHLQAPNYCFLPRNAGQPDLRFSPGCFNFLMSECRLGRTNVKPNKLWSEATSFFNIPSHFICNSEMLGFAPLYPTYAVSMIEEFPISKITNHKSQITAWFQGRAEGYSSK